MNSTLLRAAAIHLLLLSFGAAALFAQSGRGTIQGLVTDATGGVVALADVTATHQSTGVATVARADDRGRYSLVNLPVGQYTITVVADGFAPAVHRDVIVGVQSALRLDAVLALAGVAQQVTVRADAGMADAGTAAVGTALTNAIVTNLPLNFTSGRSIENFAYAITPGVEGNNYTSNIAGGVPFSKEVILDGSSATIQIQGHISESAPPMEAVEAFKVETSGISAEYGRTGGGIFNFSLRSGTNAFHGSAYGQFRHEAFNANTWMNGYLARANPSEADQYRKPQDRQKLAGTSVGGPILANRTFYFLAFEEYRQTRRQLGAYDRTVPAPAFLDGDFSALLDRTMVLGVDEAGSTIYRGAIFDPASGLVFPGNVIPADRLSPVSRRIAELYRASYRPALPDRLSANAAGPAYVDPSSKQHQFSLKVDHNITDSSRLSGSFIWTKRPRTLADQGGIWDPDDPMGGPLAKSRTHAVTSHQARISHSQVLSSSLLHVGTATFNRFRNPNTSGSAGGNWPADLGLDVPGAFDTFPQINFGDAINGIDVTDIGLGTSNFYVADVYQYNDSLTWVKGAHLLKFGGEARFIRMNSHGDRPYLEYNFTPAQTGLQSGPLANQVGSGFASFMLGEVGSASQHVPADFYGRRNYAALFVQDDFRVGEALTLNLGLRWETTGAWREQYGRWANFNTRVVNPVTGVLGAVEHADEVQEPFEGRRRYNQFGPRIGLAYTIGSRWLARGAYGVLYAPIGANYWAGVPYGFAPGFFGTNAVLPTGDGSAAFNWSSAAYPGVLTPPTKDPAFTQWGMVSISPDSLKAGRIQQWNAGIEHELTRDLTIGVYYIGNNASRLPSGDLERNQPDPDSMRSLLLAGTEWSWVSDPASAAAAGVPYPYNGFAGPAWMAITPYPQAAAGFGPLFFVGSPLGRTDYRALQITGNKRMSAGVAGAMSYTWSRQRGNVETAFQERWTSGAIQDVTALDREAHVIGSADRTHVAKGYVSWSLPFGRGRRFLRGATGLADALASGWTISAIVRYESGLPLAIRSSNAYAGWHYPIYANRNPGVPLDRSFEASRFNPSDPGDPGNQYFDPSAFSNPAYGELGTGPGRVAELRGFGGAYEDIGILKDFRFGRYLVQVKFEIINAFNRRYFADPETNLGSPYFGRVTGMGWQPPRQGQLGVRFEW